jgi:hypothetical protein
MLWIRVRDIARAEAAADPLGNWRTVALAPLGIGEPEHDCGPRLARGCVIWDRLP